MYLHLTRSQAEGYLGTYSDEGDHISTTIITVYEYEKKLKLFKSEKKFHVTESSFKSEGEELYSAFMVKERSQPMESKTDIEAQRYKQDCRKRALEMAHMEMLKWVSTFGDATKLPAGVSPNVQELADKYYNWLISIPEK